MYFTWFKPTCSCYAFSLGAQEGTGKDWPVFLERLGRGSSKDPLSPFHISSLAGILGCCTPEVAWKVVGFQCVCVLSWFILCCPEPWLMMLIMRLCSLFTSLTRLLFVPLKENLYVCFKAWGQISAYFVLFFFPRNF